MFTALKVSFVQIYLESTNKMKITQYLMWHCDNSTMRVYNFSKVHSVVSEKSLIQK